MYEFACQFVVFFLLDNALCFVAGIMTSELQNFLELNLPKVKAGKKPKISLGVAEPKLGSAILEATHIPCQSNDYVNEFLRGIRFHFSRFIKDLKVLPLFNIKSIVF